MLCLPAHGDEAQVQAEYQACVARAHEELSREEKARIQAFRDHLERKVGKLRADDSLSGVKKYSEALIEAIESGVETSENTPRLDPRFKFAVRDEKLRRVIQQSLGLRHSSYTTYLTMAYDAVYNQNSIDLDRFDRLHKDLLSKLAVHYMDENDRSAGIKVPLSITMARPDEFALAFQVTNEVSELVAELQVTNLRVSGIRGANDAQVRKALALQTIYAVGGTLAFMSTFTLGPVAVARGGLLAVQLGYRAIQGSRAAGMGVGAIGAPGALAPLTAFMTVSDAYRRSTELGTPVRCELDRQAALANFGGKMATAAAFGTGVGLVGVTAAGLSMATLRATGVMTKGMLYYSGGITAIGAAQAYHYCTMSQQLSNLENVPQHLKPEQMALAQLAQNECMAKLQDTGKHAIETATIYALYRELFSKGHLQEALHEGVGKAMGVMAYSSDAIPTVIKATGDAGASAAQSALRAAGLRVQPVVVPLSVQISQFMEKLKGASGAVDVPSFEWHFAMP